VIIGVISDTHGLLRPEARQMLKDCELILHAGDVGAPEVLDELRAIAPLHVVRGNVDYGGWADALPLTKEVEIMGRRFYLLHNIEYMDIDPAEAGIDVVIHGHTHRHDNEYRNGVLYFNPASAGPRRNSWPISMGRILLQDDGISAEHIRLVP
jgi:putative phosphoesterase